MKKLTKFQCLPHNLKLADGELNDEVWWFCDKGRVEIWTVNGCLGNISYRQLRAAMKVRS